MRMPTYSNMRLVLVLGVIALIGLPKAASAAGETDNYGGRDMIIYQPAKLPAFGARPLVVVLHGGMGNAQHIESGAAEQGLGMDRMADKDGFIVAYLNGTPATRFSSTMLAWNAGNCCGQAAHNNVDDVAYIKGAVEYIATKYGIDRSRVFGIGHSNGAMMTERLMCETNLYAAAVSVSGPLGLDVSTCPAARGKHILAIHGVDDQNVPINGGKGTKGISGATFTSEQQSKQTFTNSGATYDLDTVNDADHRLDHIDAALQRDEDLTIAEKATRFFGLSQ